MSIVPIEIPSFLGGVSRITQNGRAPFEVEDMLNCDLNPVRGTDKRAGTEHIPGQGAQEELSVTGASDIVYTFWINRSETEQFMGFINPANDGDDLIQIYNILTGVKVTVEGDGDGTGAVVLSDIKNATLRAYLVAGTQTPRERFRVLSVEDSTFILNRTVATALKGKPITYKTSTGDILEVRNRNHQQNKLSWSDFDHPPAIDTTPPITSIPTGQPGDPNEDFINDGMWYARDDDVGLPQGFYFVESAIQPLWFQRVRTEGASSIVDPATMPLRLDFDGTKFVLKPVNYTARFSGDSTTNPGPTFIGNPLSDISFFQNRMWFISGERVVSSRVDDLFNVWIDSVSVLTDGDPIEMGIKGNRISNGIYAEAFKDALVIITDGRRQVELRANGPFTRDSVQMIDSTEVSSSDYTEPTKKGSQLYFVSERDFSMLIWEYDYSPQQVANVARDITERVRGYIPAESHTLTASTAHDSLFLLNLPELDTIYVNSADFNEQNQKTLNAWHKWVLPDSPKIISVEVVDDHLYIALVRNSLVYLERLALGVPQQDTDGSPVQTLKYAVRLDRKQKLQGVYDAPTNKTTWTVPFADANLNEVVLAATWDTGAQKMAGTRVPGLTVTALAATTTIVVDGDWENNGDGVDSPAYVGRSFEAVTDLSEQFFRDPRTGQVLRGNVTLMGGIIYHRESGGYKIKITPEGRSELVKEFVVPDFVSTPLDTDQLDKFGEFSFRVMSHARNLKIQVVNDTPYPTTWTSLDFSATYIPTRNPLR